MDGGRILLDSDCMPHLDMEAPGEKTVKDSPQLLHCSLHFLAACYPDALIYVRIK